MDPLTHTLVGANLAELSPARRTRLGAAALIAGANLPDVDVLAYALGEDAARGFRRGWTHGVLAMVVLPLALALLLLLIDRWRRRDGAGGESSAGAEPWRLVALSALGVWTHPLLDWLNTYGVRLAMPFDGRWFHGDSVFIIDPWLWLALGGTLVLARRGRRPGVAFWIMLGGLVSIPVLGTGTIVPVAAKAAWIAGIAAVAALAAWLPRRSPGRLAVAGLGLAGVYLAVMVSLGAVAPRLAREALERQGIAPGGALMTAPRPANPLVWRFVVSSGDEYRWGTLHLLEGRLTLDPGRLPHPPDTPLVAAAAAAPGIQGRLGWMRFPWVEVVPDGRGHVVWFRDARYVRERRGGFGTARGDVYETGVSGTVIEGTGDLSPERKRPP